MTFNKTISFIFLFFLLFNQVSAETEKTFSTDIAEDWVKSFPLEIPQIIPIDDIDRGSYYILVDKQIRVNASSDMSIYKRYAEKAINPEGLNEISQINISYDPSYQKVSLHSLKLYRNGKVINKLDDSKISLLRQEPDLENLLYYGELTVNINLSDVRVGDIVEYSYTRTGMNPVYQGIFSYRSYLQWSIPIYLQKIRVLWGKTKPLQVTTQHTDIQISKHKEGVMTEYATEIKNADIYRKNSEAPKWFNPYAAILFSESESWSEIALWAEPLYEKAIESSPKINQITNEILNKTSNKSEQIILALKYAQDEIRYLGVETGINSHQPSLASETIDRRFGDCKDKAVLFISLLESLNVKASPGLVSTSKTIALKNYPPMVNAFNHVLVKVSFEGNTYWLDPTRSYQNHDLNSIYQPDYGYALVVDKETNGLDLMGQRLDGTKKVFKEFLDLTEGFGKPVTYTVETSLSKLSAERIRSQLAEDGLTRLQNNYLDYYRGFYDTVEPLEKMVISENEKNGDITVNEHYLLNDFWVLSKDKKRYEASFWGYAITEYFSKPKQTKRDSPFKVKFPNDIHQTVEVKFKKNDWFFEDEQVTENNKFFNYSYTAKFNELNDTLTLSYSFKSLVSYVDAKDIQQYLKARTLVRNTTEFPIKYTIESSAKTSEEVIKPLSQLEEALGSNYRYILSAISLYMSLLLFALISWLMDIKSKQKVHDSIYYPVSTTKFYTLSVATLGFYLMFWFYRNWKYIKQTENSEVMPLARAIFNKFFYYSLFEQLEKDSVERFGENKVLNKNVAALLGIIYLLSIFFNRSDLLSVFALFLVPLIFFPFIKYINLINESNGKALKHNSRWLWRHAATFIIFLPILVLFAGQGFNLTPSDHVITGDKLLSRNIQFMQRKGIVPADEKIIYFYSDAVLNINNDGNGYTENRVFSYWKDENSKFNYRSEVFKNIKNITAVFAKNILDTTVITVTGNDDSYFLLYLSNDRNLDKVFFNDLKIKWNNSKHK